MVKGKACFFIYWDILQIVFSIIANEFVDLIHAGELGSIWVALVQCPVTSKRREQLPGKRNKVMHMCIMHIVIVGMVFVFCFTHF